MHEHEQPAGKHESPDQIKKPAWLPDASAYRGFNQVYPPVVERQTAIHRGGHAIRVLRETVLPNLSGTLNILLVGMGSESMYFYCPYEPYRIFAYLESEGVPYTALLIDTDASVFEDMQRRTRIVLPQNDYDEDQTIRTAWDEYLFHTGQESGITWKEDADIRIASFLTGRDRTNAKSILGRGVLTARVPDGVREKLSNGAIRWKIGDIAAVNLADSSPFQFASATNVFYLMSEAGQKLGLYNIASSLERNGILLTDGRHGALIPPGINRNEWSGAPMLPQFGGWLTEDKMCDTGMTIDCILDENAAWETTRVVMEKIG